MMVSYPTLPSQSSVVMCHDTTWRLEVQYNARTNLRVNCDFELKRWRIKWKLHGFTSQVKNAPGDRTDPKGLVFDRLSSIQIRSSTVVAIFQSAVRVTPNLNQLLRVHD